MDYLVSAYRQPLLIAPGTDVSYQSMGILVRGEIVERITGQRLPALLRTELFETLGMDSTSLGWCDGPGARIAPATPTDDSEGARVRSANYRRRLGSPWGGAFSTVANFIAPVSGSYWTGGVTGEEREPGAGTVRMLLTDHTWHLASVPAEIRLEQGWESGLGHPSRRRHGIRGRRQLRIDGARRHVWTFGATGTVAWADPETGTVFILLTSGWMPAVRSVLGQCGNAIASAI